MKKYRARLALNDEGDRIQELIDPGGEGYPDVKWDEIHPWWVVVVDEDEIIACAQVICSKPIGHVEFLSIDEKLNPMQRAYAVKVVYAYSHVSMHQSGVFVARSSVQFGMKHWKKVIKKRWGVHQFDASIFDMRVQ